MAPAWPHVIAHAGQDSADADFQHLQGHLEAEQQPGVPSVIRNLIIGDKA
jgi:hypothetical protein